MINIETSNKEQKTLKVRDTVIKDFELSHASQRFTQKEKMPDSCLQSLKTDAQRAEELRKQSKKKDNLDPEIAEYFNKKAEEF